MAWAAGLLMASLAALAVLPAPGARAQVVEPGICPFSTPLADWDVEQFVAEPWYEFKAFAMPGLHDQSPGCTRWHFTASPDGRGLHARLVYRAAREGQQQGLGQAEEAAVRAFAQYTGSERQPRFNLTFHDLRGGASRSVALKLVASDYNDYALLWGCSEPNLFEREVVSWVLSRKPFLSEEAERALRDLYRTHDIRAEKFFETDHGAQTCGAPAAAATTPEDMLHGLGLPDAQPNSVFAPYRVAGQQLDANDGGAADAMLQSSRAERSGMLSYEDDAGRADAAGADVDGVKVEAAPASSSLEPLQGVQLGLLALLLAAVSLIASLLTFRALVRRLQNKRGTGNKLLPVHRQDVVVATLGGGVDYSRFGGGLGQGLSQTRKHHGVVDGPAAPKA